MSLSLAVELDLALRISPKPDGKADLAVRQRGADRPVFDRHERAYLFLAFDDYARGDRLNAPRRQTVLHLFPEERAELVADDAVKQTARLLRVDDVHIYRARVFDSILDRRLCYRVEGHAQRFFNRNTESGGKMP